MMSEITSPKISKPDMEFSLKKLTFTTLHLHLSLPIIMVGLWPWFLLFPVPDNIPDSIIQLSSLYSVSFDIKMLLIFQQMNVELLNQFECDYASHI